MESIIVEILERLRAGATLVPKDLLRILNDHNKQLRSSARHYSKKKLLPFYLRTKERDPDLWRSWDITPDLEEKLIALLQVKPRRSASGVATITVITKPWRCSGSCIYCPNDLRMPKSYLSDEPACQRAERNYFDPYLQVSARLRALEQMGHVTDKIELIVLGGSWSDYPRAYQVWFITELFRALNDASASAPDHSSTAQFDTLADVHARKRRAWYREAGLSYEKADLIDFTQDAQREVDAGKLSYNAAITKLYETGKPWEAISSQQQATLPQLIAEHKRNENAAHRVVGLVVETRPNAITPDTLSFLRTLGATKLQMGIQSLDPKVHQLNARPITIDQIERALDLVRLFGFKTHTHFMVNLLGATPESDKEDFKRFVTEMPYQPDEIKLYPCALVRGTELCEYYRSGAWQPYDEEVLVDVLVADLLATPGFTRISRMIRDFSAHDIEAGNKKVNLRQLVEARASQRVEAFAAQLREAGNDECAQRPPNASSDQLTSAVEHQDRTSIEASLDVCQGIQEIRHREISTQDVRTEELALKAIPYETISTHEVFLQWVTPENKIAGFLRLSLPKAQAFTTYDGALPIEPDEAMIREVHVYGRASSLHKAGTSAQHRGLGKKLIERACVIAREAGYRKINVISAIGTRPYYRNLGFVDNGLYQQKSLAADK